MAEGSEGGTAQKPAANDGDRPEVRRQFVIFSVVVGVWLLGGVIAVGLFADQSRCNGVRSALWGLGLAAGGAAALVGILAGYIFGIPKTPTENGNSGAQYRANSSIEQISDWVVKILVGLGLTQLNRAPEGMVRLAKAFERAVASVKPVRCPSECCSDSVTLAGVGQFGASLVLYFAIFGFLLGYVHMRLYLAPAFRLADDRLNEKIAAAEHKIAKAEQQKEKAEQKVQEAVKKAEDVTSQVAEYERVTNRVIDLLYKDGGFAEAISTLDDFVARFASPPDAGFWVRYACAWGQKAESVGRTSPEFADAKKKALEACERVIAIAGDAGRHWLRTYWDTDQKGPYAENDLAVFKTDPEFVALLGHRDERKE